MNYNKPKILLHVCCANCLMYPYNLLKESYDITLFYYNPNIYPGSEYNKRLSEVLRVSRKLRIPVIRGQYETKKWSGLTEHLALEPEGGKRCSICFEMRLLKTADKAKKCQFDIFTSTLSVSPHKNSGEINRKGQAVSEKYGIAYLPSDFKKQDGYKKTTELAGQLDIYRQNYCGCVYSIKRNGYKTKV